ncbi:transporter substrate-binding domain-containing protein [Carboxydothermus ferrireducens]|uniref:histidine kinase n=1 Tax=Carboxydothermus ferrireducens DSM 11255 TaxID=1119529 RepID=A0ABX2RCY8_9THEO|nr:transporter substrate-binding domain-containing protein [Carboxydothermus ferrireducens]NYE58734.1 polar amino acid transport system substrate-binding protein [Carboxydothermus ferrireducens DSM 11255]
MSKKGVRVIFGIILFIASFLVLAANLALAREKVIVVGDNDYPPLCYLDGNDNPAGFDVDLIVAVARKAGIDIEIKLLPWAEARKMVEDGKADVLLGVNYTRTRAKLYDFTESYLENRQVIFVRSDNYVVKSFDDLRNLKVGVQRADVALDFIGDYPDITLEYFENQQQALKALGQNEVDAVIGNYYTGLYWLQKLNLENKIKVVGIPLSITRYGLGVKKGQNQELLKKLNGAIVKLKTTGELDSLKTKWFGESPYEKRLYFNRIRTYVILGIFIFTAILLFILWLNRLLQQKVERATYELNLAYRELAAQKDLMDKMLEHELNGIITLDENRIIKRINNSALRILGISEKQMEGKHFSFTPLKDYFPEPFLERAYQGQTCSLNEHRVVVEGQTKYLSINFISIPSIRAVLINFRDVTEEKKSLELMINRDKLITVGQLVAGFVHEIKNPLFTVKSYLELLPLKANDPAFREEVINIIKNELDNVQKLINDLLNYARPQNSKKEMVVLEEVIAPLLNLLEPQFIAKQITVFKENLGFAVYADPMQLRHVFMNLLLNAIDAIQGKGEIKIKAAEYGDKIKIEVQDTGVGIPPQYLNQIFNLFFTSKKDGNGIGLAICQKLIQENGGSILVDSTPGAGTTFTIFLPKGVPLTVQDEKVG